MAMASAGSIGHLHTSLGGFLLDYIAGQKHPDLVLRLQGLIGEGQIAGPEDTAISFPTRSFGDPISVTFPVSKT